MKASILLFLATVIALSSCGKKSIVREYYIIEFPVQIDSAFIAQPPSNKTYCEILPIRIAPAYAQKRIVVRTGTHQLNYYLHHEWAVRPEEAISIQIENYLCSCKLFTDVSSRLFKVQPDFSLDIRIHHLEAVQEKQELVAHLHMTLELRDNAFDQPVVFHTFDERRTLAKKNINLLASSLSDILALELENFAGQIEQFLRTSQKPSAAKQAEIIE
jgi:ABC-type uncharacterized transport system auxiliary subunit